MIGASHHNSNRCLHEQPRCISQYISEACSTTATGTLTVDSIISALQAQLTKYFSWLCLPLVGAMMPCGNGAPSVEASVARVLRPDDYDDYVPDEDTIEVQCLGLGGWGGSSIIPTRELGTTRVRDLWFLNDPLDVAAIEERGLVVLYPRAILNRDSGRRVNLDSTLQQLGMADGDELIVILLPWECMPCRAWALETRQVQELLLDRHEEG